MLDIQGLRIRAALFSSIRLFFTQQGFLEVDTPLRQPIIIPENNIIPLMSEGQYLQTSPELCMKRLLANGCDKIFQVCPCFRKEERGRHHLEEFTMLEWYRTGADYSHLMNDCEELLRHTARGLAGFLGKAAGQLENAFNASNLEGPWQRLAVDEAFARFSPMAFDQALRDDRFDEILVEFVEPHLGNESPVFLYDYPRELASLARAKIDDPGKVERFELYWQGIELANGFSELTAADEQRARFLHELDLIEQKGRQHAGLPEFFLNDLEKISSAAGIALGLDRLLMLFMGRQQIADVVSFSPEDFQ